MDSLPVVTIEAPQRIIHDQAYAYEQGTGLPEAVVT
jgi:hypothetical protein